MEDEVLIKKMMFPFIFAPPSYLQIMDFVFMICGRRGKGA
jgi:hypothetical protein